MEPFEAINDFMEEHELEKDQFGNLRFNALIHYRSKGKNATEQTSVSISRNGYDEGKIRISEQGDLIAEDYHMDFTIDFQSYDYSDDTKALIVSGSSAKMNGEYSVTITPL